MISPDTAIPPRFERRSKDPGGRLSVVANRRNCARDSVKALLDLGIVGARLGAEFIQNVLPRLLRRLLAVCEARFLESAHFNRVLSMM